MSNTRPPCPITFVNSVGAHGFGNGVVNICLLAADFVPVQRGDKAEVDGTMHVAANLRMDLFCAQQLRDSLDAQIEAAKVVDKPATAEVN